MVADQESRKVADRTVHQKYLIASAAHKLACSRFYSGNVDCVWNVMAHAQKPDFVFRRNGRVHLNRQGASFQSTTGSRSVRISGSNARYTMFRGSVKSTGYPLHSPVSPSLPLPCATVCHHVSTGLCYLWHFSYRKNKADKGKHSQFLVLQYGGQTLVVVKMFTRITLSSSEDMVPIIFPQGDLGGGLLYWGTRKMRFLRDAKCPVNGAPSP